MALKTYKPTSPGQRQLVRDQPARNAGTNDDDICLLGGGHYAFLSIGLAAQNPGLLGQ